MFDEVMTSRLAPGGLQSSYGITSRPDDARQIYRRRLPFGAFGGRADIMARFDPAAPDAFPHGGTFNNNVLTMAAGLAGFDESPYGRGIGALQRSGRAPAAGAAGAARRARYRRRRDRLRLADSTCTSPRCRSPRQQRWIRSIPG